MSRPIMAFLWILLVSGPAMAWGEVDDAIEAAEAKLKNISSWERYSDKVTKATKAAGLIDPVLKKYETKEKIYSENEISALFAAKGECLYQMLEYEQALENFQLSLKHNHENSKALAKVALILSSAPEAKLRDGAKAKEVSKKALVVLKMEYDKIVLNFNTDLKTRQNQKLEVARQSLLALHAMGSALAEMEDFKGAVDFLAEVKAEETAVILELFRNSKKYRLPSKQDGENKEKAVLQKEMLALQKEKEAAAQEKKREAEEAAKAAMEAKAMDAKLDDQRKKLEAREIEFAKNTERLPVLEKEFREAGKKSTAAQDDDEQTKWKEVSKKKYAEWKKLKMDLEIEKQEIALERKRIEAKRNQK